MSEAPFGKSGCPRPEQLADWAESGSARDLPPEAHEHVLRCPRCAREYRALRELWQSAARASTLRGLAGRVFAPTSVGASTSSSHFDWGVLRAASSDEESTHEAVFCEGALHVTLWSSGGELILTAENDPTGMWVKNEGGELEHASGGGLILAGELVQYRLDLANDQVDGFFALPPMVEGALTSAAEVTLGFQEWPIRGDLTCRIAAPVELTATGARTGVRRARDRVSREAWEALVARRAAEFPEEALHAIRDEMAAGTGSRAHADRGST